jgi:selenide,water dikinase
LAGVSSVLMPVNRKDTQVDSVEDELLYDPKTAGGLLAAVPKEYSESVLEALALKGCAGHVIGGLTEGTGLLRLS